jgi:hypothetical protein
MLRSMAVNARRLLSAMLLASLTGCTHSASPNRTAASPAAVAPSTTRCTGTPPLREGPAALAVMHKSQRSGMYPYLRLARGQQVQALVPSNVQHFTVKVSGDSGVLTPLGQGLTAKGGTLLRYAVADKGSASIDAISTVGGVDAVYIAGVTASC